MKFNKTQTVIAAFVAAIMLVSAPAIAKKKTAEPKGPTVEEALKAQQAEIENLKKEIGELKVSKGGQSGYDHGFFIKSQDDLYAFKVRFFAEIFYEYDANEDAPDVNTFGIQRARLLLSGNVFNKNLTYMVMTEMATQYSVPVNNGVTIYTVQDSGGDTSTFTVTDRTDRNFRLLYLWAQYRFADEFQVRFGEFIPPTEFFFRASNLLQFENFPIIATAEPFTPNFQTGLDLLGTIGKKLDYEIFAVNGSNFDNRNFNKSFRIGPCITYNILGKPELGVADVNYSEKPQLALTLSGAYERWDYPVAAPASINAGDTSFRGQTNLVFRYKGFSFVPEFIVFYNKTQHYKHYAMAAQAGYFVIPKHLELAAQGNLLKYSGPQNDYYEISGGLNYYFYGHPLKLQADYSALINKLPGGDQLNHRIRVGLQAGFF